MSFSVSLEVDPRHESVSSEDRQAIIAIFAFRRRFEDFQQLFEAKQLVDTAAVPEHRIKWRQQHAPISAGPDTPQASGKRQIGRPDPAGYFTSVITNKVTGSYVTGFDKTVQGSCDGRFQVFKPPGLSEGSGCSPAMSFQSQQQ